MESREFRDKSLFYANEKGEALPVSVEEALAKNLTNFSGWHCAVGIENIHISSDGSVFGGACRNNGYLGNIYEQSFYLKSEWHVCTRKSCNCGADMQIRKAKSKEFIPKTFQDMPQKIVKEMDDAVYVAPVHQEAHRLHPVSLTWDLGRRCNYSCSYCNPAIANNYEAHKTWGSLMYALEGLENKFLKGRCAKFVFTGGEPTVNPKYMDFVKHLKEKGHFIHTTTNGSRLPAYYAELLEASFLGFSYHLEFAKLEHFQQIVSALIERKKQSQRALYSWCGIRIMVPPGEFEKALAVKRGLLSVEGLQESGILVFMSPCYDKNEHTKIMNYTGQELEQITLHAEGL